MRNNTYLKKRICKMSDEKVILEKQPCAGHPSMSSENMLKYQKGILQKVSFNQELFEKELTKTKEKGWLSEADLKSLVQWVWENFHSTFTNLKTRLSEMFSDIFSDLFGDTPDNVQLVAS